MGRIFTQTVLLLICLVHISIAEPAIKFQFNPDTSRTVLQTVDITRTIVMPDTPVQTDKSTSEIKIRYSKLPNGFIMKAIPQSIAQTRNDVEVDNPLYAITINNPLTYTINTAGQITSITGFDGYLRTLYNRFEKKAADNIKPLIQTEVIKEREVEEWQNRVGNWISKTGNVGDEWTQNVTHQLPNGEDITYPLTSKIVKWETVNDKPYLRITQRWASEDQTRIPTIKGQLVRLIQPDTCEIIAEKTSEEIRFMLNIPKRGPTPVTIREKRTYEIE